MEDIVKQILGCFKDLEGDPNNKEILSAIREKTKSLIMQDNELSITRELCELFKKYDMELSIFNNTNNIPDQYIIYVNKGNNIGVSIIEVSKNDIVK